MFTRVAVTSRPSVKVSAPGGPDGRDAAAISPPETAAATKSMPTNNRPLPRNTVAKNRSSRSPIRSRSTPMNHKKAMPANGTRFSAITTAARRPGSVSHAPATPGWAGTESLSSTSAAIRNTENTTPATAAARGVRSGLPACSGPWPTGPSVIGLPSRPVAGPRHPFTRTRRRPSRTTGAGPARARHQRRWATRWAGRVPPRAADRAGDAREGQPHLLAGEHGRGLTLQVDVGVAADVDGDALDGAAGEGVRVRAGVVVGDRFAAVAADAQALARDREHSWLGLDPALADLLIPVVEGQDPGGHARRVLTVLVERGRQDQVLPGRKILGPVDLLLHH